MQIPLLIGSLQQLQSGQLRHDSLAHQDIFNLVLPSRLTHFTLHFAKYQAGLYSSISNGAKATRRRLITDSMIIALAAANGMKVDLKTNVGRSISTHDNHWTRCSTTPSFSDLVGYYIETVGRMAKACEALDHLENFPAREVLERSVVELTLTIIVMSQVDNFDLCASIEKRWSEIENGLTFIAGDKPSPVRHLARA
jgi:hypothetical protein